MIAATEPLRSIPLFAASSDRSIEVIASIVEEASFAPGEVLVQQGDPGDSLIVIRSGAATVEQDGRMIRSLRAGDFLGEIALIDGGVRTATVTATEPIEALTIGREGFTRLMEEFPVIRYDLVTALTRRLRDRGSDPTD
jgi:CRP/FNR family cyclic AMP-dependent transcriptional regulator